MMHTIAENLLRFAVVLSVIVIALIALNINAATRGSLRLYELTTLALNSAGVIALILFFALVVAQDWR